MAATCLASWAPLSKVAEAQEAGARSGQQILELRLYHVASEAKQKRLIDFFREAAIPALNRIGVGPVGVFEFIEDQTPNLYVLLPHNTPETVLAAGGRLIEDREYLKAGAAVLDAPKADPAYQRIESSLMLAFDGVPRLRTPAKGKSRVFQLRTYESHNAERAQKKIEMFNTGGELDIFRRVGLPVVFMGQALIGTKLPNLTYMLAFDDEAAKEKGWAGFMKDPGWLKLKDDPQYKDTVCNITNIVLRPAAGSQI